MAVDSDSDEEWELEQRVFHAANDPNLNPDVRRLIKELWQEVCDRSPAPAPK
jgi:hypothetical protein